MYKVMGYHLDKEKNIRYFAVINDSDMVQMPEVLSEIDLCLLLQANFDIRDSSGARCSLNNSWTLVGDIPDLTASFEVTKSSDLEFDDYDEEDYDDDYDDDYDEDGYDEEDPDYDDDISEEESESLEEGQEVESEYEEDDYDLEDEYDIEDEYVEDYYDEEADYYDDYDEEESTVSKLYGYLNAEQIKTLKRYYLWYSQRIFSEGQKDPSLGMKSKAALARKKKDLDTLRNTGGLWHYAGFVDLGGEKGYCTLGHKLRYMHLAWDVTVSDIETAFFGEKYDSNFEDAIYSNNCIVFGIKCIADFFEVDKECVQRLQKAQRESLKDMAIMCKYYEDGVVNEVCDTFKLLDELIETTSGIDAMKLLMGGETLIPADISAFYMQFRQNGMIPPKSLVQELRDKLIGWTEHKFIQEIRSPKSSVLLPKIREIFGLDADKAVKVLETKDYRFFLGSWAWNYLTAFTQYKICGIYEYNADTNKDEGGASKTVKYELSRLYKEIDRGFTDIEYSMGYLQRVLKLVGKAAKIPNNDLRFCYPEMYRNEEGIYEPKIMDTYWRSVYFSDFAKERCEGFDEAMQFISDLYRYYSSGSKLYKYTLSEYEALLDSNLKIVEDNAEKFSSWAMTKVGINCSKRNEEIKAERLRREREEQARLEEEARKRAELEMTREEESERQEHEAEAEQYQADETKDKVLSDTEILDYLKLNDMNSVVGMDFNKQVLDTVIKSGRAPSSRQMYYLKALYEKHSGVSVSDVSRTDRVDLSTRPDLQMAMQYVIKNNLGDEKTRAICSSILKYGTISERQMKYALKAEEYYLGKEV